MFRSGRSRLLVVILTLLILTFFFTWYGSLEPDPEKSSYPSQEHLIEDYDAYIGEEVKVGGKVIDTDPVKIEAEHGDESIELNITGVEESVEKGDRLTVYGVLKEDKTIAAENAVRHPFLNWNYMYIVSGAAAVWVLIRIVKQWRWDPETASLKVREEPLSLKDMISGKNEQGGPDDG